MIDHIYWNNFQCSKTQRTQVSTHPSTQDGEKPRSSGEKCPKTRTNEYSVYSAEYQILTKLECGADFFRV